MTTQTMRRNTGGPGVLELMALLMIVAACLALASLAIPKIAASTHASLHEEADIIRQCFDKGDIQQVWINSSLERLNCLVQLPDGRTGDRVIQWCRKSGWKEVTAFVLGDGSLAEIIRVLNEKACTKVW